MTNSKLSTQAFFERIATRINAELDAFIERGKTVSIKPIKYCVEPKATDESDVYVFINHRYIIEFQLPKRKIEAEIRNDASRTENAIKFKLMCMFFDEHQKSIGVDAAWLDRVGGEIHHSIVQFLNAHAPYDTSGAIAIVAPALYADCLHIHEQAKRKQNGSSEFADYDELRVSDVSILFDDNADKLAIESVVILN